LYFFSHEASFQDSLPRALPLVHLALPLFFRSVFSTANDIAQEPLIAYGNGTSLEGHTAAVNGGVVINFENFDKIVKINEVRVSSPLFSSFPLSPPLFLFRKTLIASWSLELAL